MWRSSALSWGIPCSGLCWGGFYLVSPCPLHSVSLPSDSQHLFLLLAHHFCVFDVSSPTVYMTLDQLMFKLPGVGSIDTIVVKPVPYSRRVHAFMAHLGGSDGQ